MGKISILNSGPLPETKPEIEIDAHLRSDINRLKGEFYDLERGRVPIFRWYNPDFGGHRGILATLFRYLDQGNARDFLMANGTTAKIEWKFYDWHLNR